VRGEKKIEEGKVLPLLWLKAHTFNKMVSCHKIYMLKLWPIFYASS
jgi:hypothetical protein